MLGQSEFHFAIFLAFTHTIAATSTFNSPDKPRSQSQVSSHILAELLSFLRTKPENYVLWLHSQTSVLKWDLNDECYLEGIRLLTYFSYPDRTSSVEWETSFKFTQNYHIIFGSYHLGESNGIIGNTFIHSMSIYVVYILLGYSGDVLLSSFALESVIQAYLPAMKIRISFDFQSTHPYRYTVQCSGYCTEKQLPWTRKNIQNLLGNPPDQHKRHFRNANAKRMAALYKPRLYWQGTRSFFEFERMDSCVDIFLRNYKYMPYCENYIMSIMILGHEHNISWSLLPSYSEFSGSESNVFILSNPYILGYSTAGEVYEAQLLTGIYFSDSSEDRVLYCDVMNDFTTMEVTLWTCAFNPDTWIFLLLFTILFLSVLARLNYSSIGGRSLAQETFGMYTIFVGQFPSRLGRTVGLYFGITGVTFLIKNLYENSITSSVTVQIPLPVYRTVNDLLSDGYKLMWFVEAYKHLGGSPQDFYGMAFFNKKITTNIDDAFQLLDGSSNYDRLALLLKSRMAAIVGTDIEKVFTPHMKKLVVGDGTGNWNCRYAAESLYTSFLKWHMYAVNKAWLMETIERIHQAGLRDKIRELSEWAFNLVMGTLEIAEESVNKPVPLADVIDMYKLWFPLVTMTTAVIVSVIVFCLENRRLFNSRKRISRIVNFSHDSRMISC